MSTGSILFLSITMLAACAGTPELGSGDDVRTERVDVDPGMTGTTIDAMVPGTGFHATGMIPCAQKTGQPMGQCEFGVVREGGGSGKIEVFWPEGGNRVLFFEDGTPMSFDGSETDAGAEMTVGKEEDLFVVRIGAERFEIPDVVIVGDNPY